MIYGSIFYSTVLLTTSLPYANSFSIRFHSINYRRSFTILAVEPLRNKALDGNVEYDEYVKEMKKQYYLPNQELV